MNRLTEIRMSATFKKVDRDLRRNPEMSFRFIEDHRDTYPIQLMCAMLDVSPADYYAWRDRRVSERTKSNATLLAVTRQAHRDSSGRYGSPRVHAVLRTQGRGDHGRGVVPGGCYEFFSRKIVGWAMRDHMQVELASAALTRTPTVCCGSTSRKAQT
ncbi:hypothetical protein ACNJYD_09735 [Bradyrhizobium sp. DASA03005]|uniref:hypothetical protein n=1 Tax=Bradyrhizobium sp. SPXBL-02 TaxID=3395912 RepID=UPI003F6ED8CB